ncbi:MAG: DUF6537 domain-containing protein, partial [Pseudomonadota bacterium]
YKDEYEVARLHLATEEKARAAFGGDFKMTFHLAPPLLSRTGPDGRPAKRAFGPWVLRAFRILAGLKALRGTPFDPFGYTRERRTERALIRQYERDLGEVQKLCAPGTLEAAVAWARLPLQIRGFGPVKEANIKAAALRRAELLDALRSGPQAMDQAAE